MKTFIFLWLWSITLVLADPPVTSNSSTVNSVGTSASRLSKEEEQELGKAYYGALKANPNLVELKRQLLERLKEVTAAGQIPSDDIKKGLIDYQKLLFTAMIKEDPNVQIILDKTSQKAAP